MLNRTYQNTFGIYANATHAAITPTTAASATGITGGNSGLGINNNTISNVNNGILVVGPTAAADYNNGVLILANTITNYGNTGTFSPFANVSGSVFGILVRNTTAYSINTNTITSAIAGTVVTAGALRGIFVPGFSATPTGTYTNTINGNILDIKTGFVGGFVAGIDSATGSGSTLATININGNIFNGLGHSIAAPTGNLVFINQQGIYFTVVVSNNAFNSLTAATTGNVTFIAASYTMPVAGVGSAPSQTYNLNGFSAPGGFSKTGAGGLIICYTTGSSSPAGTLHNFTNNNFSNITVTGITGLTGYTSTDGGGTASPTKTVTGNTFSNWTVGTGSIFAISSNFSSAGSITGNTVNNITGQANITGITLGTFGTGAAATQTISGNTITNLSSTGVGGNVVAISNGGSTVGTININANIINTLSTTNASGQVIGVIAGAGAGSTVNIFNHSIFALSSSGATGPLTAGVALIGTTGNINVYKNKIYNISATGASTTNLAANGIAIQGGLNVSCYNNLVGDITNPLGSGLTAVTGIQVISTVALSTYKVYYNTVFLNASSTGATFGSAAFLHGANATATTGALDLINNVFVNNSVANGTGLSVAYRRTTVDLNNYATTSNRNDFFAPVIFADGTNAPTTLAAFQTLVATREVNSISANPSFLTTVGAAATFLHINPTTPSLLESAGVNIPTFTDDFDADVRQGNAGYAGTGTAPDMGADEFNLAVVACTVASGGVSATSAASICAGGTAALSNTGATTTGTGLTYQWQVSTTSGGPYANVVGGTGATSFSYTSAALTPNTYYYILRTTCANGPVSGNSNQVTIVVNPVPVTVVTPTSGTFCNPGGTAIVLAASGATTYVWSPAAGLSATTGASVSASPTVTTTYTVTGTTAGCSSTATVTITAAAGVTVTPATATNPTICAGGNSQLNVVATSPFNNTAAVYAFSASSGTYTAITGTTLAIAPATVDDGGTGNLPIGFTFNYNGTAHTVFGARTNGLIELSQVTPALVGFSNNALASATNCIAPLWDDNNMTGGTIIYATTGTTPNRILTVQWTGMHVGGGGSATNPTIDAQVRLYEANGVVEFVYGATSAALVGTTASIGISGIVGNFKSISPLLPVTSSTSGSIIENTAINSATNFPSGTIYTFTPPVAPIITYAWLPTTFLNNATIANPLASAITGTTTYTVTATAGACSTTSTVTVTVTNITVTPATSASTLTVGTPVTITLASTGGATPYAYTSGALPAGLTLVAGVISGTPTTAQAATPVTITSTDANSCTGTVIYTFTVNGAPTTCSVLTNGTNTVPVGTVGTAYSFDASVTPSTSVNYTTTSTLPAGLALGLTTGLITGTPTAATVPAGVSVTISALQTVPTGCTAVTRTITIIVNAVPTTCSILTNGTNTVPVGTVGVAYTFSGAVTSVPAITAITYTTVSTLPAGLSLNATTGEIAGTPTAATVAAGVSVTINALQTVPTGCTAVMRTITIIVNAPLVCPTGSTLPTLTLTPAVASANTLVRGTVGVAFSQQFTATPAGTYTYAITTPVPAIPAELTFNTATGLLSGTPSFSTSLTFRVTATNALGCANLPNLYSLVINASPTTAIDNSLANLVKVSPNPSSGDFNVDFGTINMAKSSVRVYDAQGKVVFISENNSNLMTISLDKFANGIYLMEVETSKGRILKRLAKQ